MSFTEISYPDDLDIDLEYFRQMLADQLVAYSVEKRYIRGNGSTVWVNLTVSSVKKDSGEIDYLIAVIEDISDRKQAEAALAESRTQLERANQAKDSFIAHMGHELRTPLNSIIGFSEILQRDPELSARQSQNVDIVHRSSKHLLTLINDILDFSKIEAGKLDLEIQKFNLNDFLLNLVDIFRFRARQKGLQFNYQADSNLPHTVETDETRLRQVLLNLLGNAIKYTQTGKIVFSVGYPRHAADDNGSDPNLSSLIRFEIKDTGRGIPEDKLASIFLPFEQLPDDIENHQGTGLGLTISQKILQLMGSQINLESTVGKGSRFWFDLELPDSELPDSEPPLQLRAISSLKQPRKILVVDDNFDNRYLLINYLRPLGFILEEAENGQTGLIKAASFQPDAILLDLVMPVMDGKAMTAEIRRNSSLQNIKIFIISANVQYLRERQEIDCNGFLQNPWT